MGAAVGSPINDEVQARIQQLITEVIENFALNFPINFSLAIVEKVRLEIDPIPDWKDDLKLEEAPPADFTLKEGTFKKRGGAQNSSEKERYFVAKNAADNFVIEYFTKKGGAKKGEVNCCGYYVNSWDTDHKEKFGSEYGVRLSPWSSRRRTWIFIFADKATQDEWSSVFSSACWRANAPRDENECIASAFATTLQNLRWQYGMWGYYYSWGTESERLQDFIACAIAEQVVDAVFADIPIAFGYWTMYETVWTGIASTVRIAVDPMWKTVRAAAEASQPTIEAKVKENGGPLFEKQKEFKDKIVGMINDTTGPFLADVGGRLLRPFLDIAVRPIARIFGDSIRGFQLYNAKKIESSAYAPGQVDSTLSDLSWRINWWGDEYVSSPFGPSYRLINKLCWEELYPLNPLFEALSGFDCWTVYNSCQDNLQMLGNRAIYTLGKYLKSFPDNPTAAVMQIMNKFLHDAKLMVKHVIKEIFNFMLDSTVNQTVRTPAMVLIAPLQELIDAIPVVNDLIKLPDMLSEVIDRVVDNGIDAVLEGGLAHIDEHMDEVRAEFNVPMDA